MGRPFKGELESLRDTYEFADSLDVSMLIPFFKHNTSIPLLIIGSGGSFAVAKMFELCYQKFGGFAKAITPYELKNMTNILGNSKVLIVTAGGNNPDTVGAYSYVRLYEPFEICVVCMSRKSKIAKEIKQNKDAVLFEVSIPFGKDGYLAVNSSIAMFTIVKNLVQEIRKKSVINFERRNNLFPVLSEMSKISNFIVLYGGWGAPAAYDFESKCSEAGLMSMQFVDYRNFAHGRHNWIDKNRDTTMIVALITPEDKAICIKTIQKVPDNVPILYLETKNTECEAAIELLINVFYLVDYLGEFKGIDPGQPHVPDYGSKLYHIKYNLCANDKFLKDMVKNTKKTCIYRKMKNVHKELTWYNYYSEKYDDFVNKLCAEKYGAILLDYDGTICEKDGRIHSNIVCNTINEMLRNDIVVGFATGRGDSITQQLRMIIEKKYWDKVIVGYYNGSYISSLSEDPEFQNINTLKSFYDLVISLLPLEGKLINKNYQLSIREKDIDQLQFYFEILSEIKRIYGYSNIHIYMSEHAVDIVSNDIGKQKVVEFIREKKHVEVLCIGDEGKVYQNDFDILTRSLGISVNHQNHIGCSGWNLAPLGLSNARSTEFYFQRIKISEKFFSFEISDDRKEKH